MFLRSFLILFRFLGHAIASAFVLTESFRLTPQVAVCTSRSNSVGLECRADEKKQTNKFVCRSKRNRGISLLVFCCLVLRFLPFFRENNLNLFNMATMWRYDVIACARCVAIFGPPNAIRHWANKVRCHGVSGPGGSSLPSQPVLGLYRRIHLDASEDDRQAAARVWCLIRCNNAATAMRDRLPASLAWSKHRCHTRQILANQASCETC